MRVLVINDIPNLNCIFIANSAPKINGCDLFGVEWNIFRLLGFVSPAGDPPFPLVTPIDSFDENRFF